MLLRLIHCICTLQASLESSCTATEARQPWQSINIPTRKIAIQPTLLKQGKSIYRLHLMSSRAGHGHRHRQRQRQKAKAKQNTNKRHKAKGKGSNIRHLSKQNAQGSWRDQAKCQTAKRNNRLRQRQWAVATAKQASAKANAQTKHLATASDNINRQSQQRKVVGDWLEGLLQPADLAMKAGPQGRGMISAACSSICSPCRLVNCLVVIVLILSVKG